MREKERERTRGTCQCVLMGRETLVIMTVSVDSFYVSPGKSAMRKKSNHIVNISFFLMKLLFIIISFSTAYVDSILRHHVHYTFLG